MDARVGLARPWWMLLAAAAIVSFIVAACSSTSASLSVGDEAPRFNGPTAGGGAVDLASLTENYDAVAVVFYRGYF